MTHSTIGVSEPPPHAARPAAEAAASPSRRGRILRRIALYSASRGLAEALLALRGIALASLLGPAAFGSWALLRLSVRYASLAGLGVNRGLELLLMLDRPDRAPRAEAGASPDDRELATRTALGFSLAVFGPMAALALAASFLAVDPERALVLRGFAAGIIVEHIYAQSLVRLRASGNLRRYATVELVQAVIQLGLTSLFAFFWGLGGAFVGLILGYIAGIGAVPEHLPRCPTLAWSPLRRLLGVGTPLVLSTVLALALGSADRWVVAAAAGTEQLGYYAFAASAAGAAASFALVIRVVIVPDIYAGVRTAGSDVALRVHLDRVVLPFARLYPPILGALALAIGPVVSLVLPGYTEAIAPARIFMLTGAAAGLVSLATVGAVAAGQQRALPAITAVALLINVALSALAIHAGAGLEGVAAGSLIGQVIFAAGVLALGVGAAGGPAAARARRFVPRALLPLVWSAAAVFLLGRLLPGHDAASAFSAAGFYLILMVPLVPAGWAEVRRLRG